jgi:hypothetical protein
MKKVLLNLLKFQSYLAVLISGLSAIIVKIINPNINDLYLTTITIGLGWLFVFLVKKSGKYRITDHLTLDEYIATKQSLSKLDIILIKSIIEKKLNIKNQLNEEIILKGKEIFKENQSIQIANKLKSLNLLIELNLWECENIFTVTNFGIDFINELKNNYDYNKL